MPRGFKECPACHKSVGPRTRICECSHAFIFKQGKTPTQQSSSPPARRGPPPLAHRKPPQLPVHESTPEERACRGPSVVTVIRLGDRAALKRFITELQEATVNSNRNGGLYSAFLPYKDNETKEQRKLEVEIWLPMRNN